MKKSLEESGYDVTATSSGKEAIGLIHDPLPDLLILDLNMPEPDGFDILKIERALLPYLRILVISGCLSGALLEAASLLGAVSTLEKPFSPEVLVWKVRMVLGDRSRPPI